MDSKKCSFPGIRYIPEILKKNVQKLFVSTVIYYLFLIHRKLY